MEWKIYLSLLLVVLSLPEQDACPLCDSNPRNCRKIQGIYTVRRLQLGYNAILTVPKGACHINVSELKPSSNYLALRSSDGSSIINGDWKLSAPGIYPGAGTRFLYSRGGMTCQTECIQSQGPLAANITIQVIYYSTNQGILYDFMLPVNTSFTTFSGEDVNQKQSTTQSSTSRRNRGTVRNPNSRHRIQNSRVVSNQRRYPDNVEIVTNPRELEKNRQYYMRKVTHRLRPTYIPVTVKSVQRQELRSGIGQKYNDINTDYQIRNTSYFNVSRTSNNGNFNTIKLDNSLVRNISSYDTRIINNRYSSKGVQTNDIINEDDDKEIRWKAGNWSSCSVPCGKGSQTREVLCQRKLSYQNYVSVSQELCDHGQVPLTTRECYSGPCGDWVVGDWGQCSVRCGRGVQMRRVECKTQSGILLPNSLCSQSAPNETRTCDMGPCQYKWIFTSWTKQCRNSCGNVTRLVRCATSAGSVVADSHCNPRDRPQTQKECSNNRDCDREWYSGPFGKCSVSCGTGVKSRDILCISTSNHTILPDDECDSRTRPVSQRRCEQKACDSSWFMTDWSKCSAKCNGGTKVRSVLCLNENKRQSRRCETRRRPRETKRCNIRSCKIQTTTPDSSCVDSYVHCSLVVRARLCKYDYYRQMCCRSCIYQSTENT